MDLTASAVPSYSVHRYCWGLYRLDEIANIGIRARQLERHWALNSSFAVGGSIGRPVDYQD